MKCHIEVVKKVTSNHAQTVIIIVSHRNLFLGQFFPRGKGAMRLTLCEAPTCETRPDHNDGNYVPYSF